VLWSFAIIAVVGSIGWNWFLVLSTGSGFVGFRHHRCYWQHRQGFGFVGLWSGSGFRFGFHKDK
jgi:hypothetical protein